MPMSSPEAVAGIRSRIAGQYRSALTMLGAAIELCPQTLWLEATPGSPNRFWHIAYHALFYTHFYLAPSESDFVPWAHGRPEYHFLGAVPWRPNEVPVVDVPYTQAELLAYRDFSLDQVAIQTAALDLDAPSGFYWLPFSKFELQLYNLRHISHHTGQLAERLRSQAGIGLPWTR
jgi:hypothetical protein